MNYKKIVSGIQCSVTKEILGVILEVDEGLYVRYHVKWKRLSFAWSPLIYGKWDPYGVECPIEKVPRQILDEAKAALERIEKPDPTDIMGGSETYERVVALFGAFDEQDGGAQ